MEKAFNLLCTQGFPWEGLTLGLSFGKYLTTLFNLLLRAYNCLGCYFLRVTTGCDFQQVPWRELKLGCPMAGGSGACWQRLITSQASPFSNCLPTAAEVVGDWGREKGRAKEAMTILVKMLQLPPFAACRTTRLCSKDRRNSVSTGPVLLPSAPQFESQT